MAEDMAVMKNDETPQRPYVTATRSCRGYYPIAIHFRREFSDGVGVCDRLPIALAVGQAAAAAVEIICDSVQEVPVVYNGIDNSYLPPAFIKVNLDQGSKSRRSPEPYVLVATAQNGFQISFYDRRNGRILSGFCTTFEMAYAAAECWRKVFCDSKDCKERIEIFNDTPNIPPKIFCSP